MVVEQKKTLVMYMNFEICSLLHTFVYNRYIDLDSSNKTRCNVIGKAK